MARKTMILMALVAGLGLMALAVVRGQEDASQPRSEESAQRLRQVVQTAAQSHRAYCNKFLAAALENYLGDGVTYSQGGSIKNLYSGIGLDEMMNADAQIDYMRTHWERVDLHRAMQLANQGRFVVAGMKSQPGLRNPPGYDQHGHVGVVMPGGPHPQTRWPVVAGGGSAAARSVEGKPMNYVWNPYFLHPRLQVEFFTPRFTPQTVAVDVKPHRTEQTKAETKGFTYRKDAPKQVGSLSNTIWEDKKYNRILKFTDDPYDRPTSMPGKAFYQVGSDGKLFDNNRMGLRGTWQQTGNTLTLFEPAFSDGSRGSTYKGAISGNSISGTITDFDHSGDGPATFVRFEGR